MNVKSFASVVVLATILVSQVSAAQLQTLPFDQSAGKILMHLSLARFSMLQ